MPRIARNLLLILLCSLLGNHGVGQVYFDKLYLSAERGEGSGVGATQHLSSGYVCALTGIPNGETYSVQSMFIADQNGNLVSSFDLPYDESVLEFNTNLIVLDDSTVVSLSFPQDTDDPIPGDFRLRFIDIQNQVVLWDSLYGEPTRLDIPQRIIKTSDNGYAMVGQVTFVDSLGEEDGQVMLVRTDSVGHELWERYYGGSLFDSGRGLVQTTDGGFLILGWTRSFGAFERDFYLLRVDSLGFEQWFETYNVGDEIGRSILKLTNGNYLLTGGGSSGSLAWGYLYEVTSAGQQVWSEQYQSGHTPADFLYKTIQLSDGSLVSCGLADNSNTGGNAGWLLKTNGSGELIWQRVYDKNQFTDLFYSVLATEDGGFLLSGQAINDSTNSQDVWLLKVDSIGCPYPNCTVGIDELGSQDVLVDVWPNPTNDVLNLEIAVNYTTAPVSVTVVDMQGRVVCKDRDCHGRSSLAMTGKTEIDVSNWPNGLYVLTLTTDEQQASVRVVVQH